MSTARVLPSQSLCVAVTFPHRVLGCRSRDCSTHTGTNAIHSLAQCATQERPSSMDQPHNRVSTEDTVRDPCVFRCSGDERAPHTATGSAPRVLLRTLYRAPFLDWASLRANPWACKPLSSEPHCIQHIQRADEPVPAALHVGPGCGPHCRVFCGGQSAIVSFDWLRISQCSGAPRLTPLPYPSAHPHAHTLSSLHPCADEPPPAACGTRLTVLCGPALGSPVSLPADARAHLRATGDDYAASIRAEATLRTTGGARLDYAG